MTNKEQVLRIYPSAVMLRNLQQWTDPSNLILVDDVPQILLKQLEEGIIDLDKWFVWPSKMTPLSQWVETEDQCWADAWLQIQRKMIGMLDE